MARMKTYQQLLDAQADTRAPHPGAHSLRQHELG